MCSWFRPYWLPLLAAGGWAVFIGVGLALLYRYQLTPGEGANPPRKWPADSSIRRTGGLPMLVLMLHPHCPCSRATVTELTAIMTRCQGRLRAHVLFLKPAGFPADWEKTDLWKNAARVPSVVVSVDANGIEAHKFHVSTSGQAMLYDSAGRLLFNGGITASRGHPGENEGRNALVALLGNQAPALHRTPVYGCSLFAPEFDLKAEKPSCTK